MKGPIATLTIDDIVQGFGRHGHNLQDYINALTDAVPEDVAAYHLRKVDGKLCVYYTTAEEDSVIGEKWNRLVDLLEEADALQQELLGADHAKASYQYHSDLNAMADEFTDWANEKGYDIA